jgi:3alpha(or 20beta)-hydroxysteroid dehydrogenase
MGSRLEGKVAIVTGGARGLGEGVVRRFVAEGARVLVTDLLEAEGGALCQQLGGNARFSKHDVCDEAGWDRVVGEAEAAWGPVDVLVNNAGIIQWGKNLVDLSFEEYRKIVAVNQDGTFLGMRAVVPSMRRAGGGSIVNFSSSAGLVGYAGILPYVAAKSAVRGMTKAAAAELGKDRIRVNSVHPCFIKSEMTKDLDEPVGEPLGRKGDPAELAAMVLFLATDESAYATGAEFVMDGGHTAVRTA